MAHDVFICHSSRNKTVADAVCAGLEARGIRCWIAPRDVLAGTVWAASINSAIRGSRVMLLIYSRHANGSNQVLRELERAVAANVAILPLPSRTSRRRMPSSTSSAPPTGWTP